MIRHKTNYPLVRDILDLDSTNISDAEARIEQLYRWKYESAVRVVQVFLGAAGALLAAVVVALFQGSFTQMSWRPVVAIMIILLPMIYGFFRLARLSFILREYVEALRVLARIRQASGD